MTKNEPVDARIRLAIAQWPDDEPRGSITTFCAGHGITHKTFSLRDTDAQDTKQTD